MKMVVIATASLVQLQITCRILVVRKGVVCPKSPSCIHQCTVVLRQHMHIALVTGTPTALWLDTWQ